ncbi:MAG: DUF5110 domain-containing protein [Verrucomicrobia bacterium]|nr:DUF5110 domain-containing protein [Verrucomicrobiota bacterium]
MMKSQGTNRKVRVWALGMLVAMAALTSSADIQIAGSLGSNSILTDSIGGNKTIVFDVSTGGALEITPFAPDLIRVRFHWNGMWEKEDISIAKPLPDWTSVESEFRDEGDKYIVETSELIVEIVKSPNFKVHFKDKSGFYLLRDIRTEYDTEYQPLDDASYADVRWTEELPEGFKLKSVKEMPWDEAYFGFGEYPGPLNRRGHTIQGWNSDTYHWEELQNPMYMTLPFFYGVRGAGSLHPAFAYGVFFNNPARPVFRMGTEWADSYSFEAGDGQIDYFFFGGGSEHSMKGVLNRYSELTGKPYMLPKWAFGYHQSRWSYDNQEWVETLADEFANHDFPLDAVYIDIDYMDQDADDWYPDNQIEQLKFNFKFPDPAGMIDYCDQRGVKLVPIVEPWLMTGDPKWQDAFDQGHLLRDNAGNSLITNIWFGNVSWIDFSSSAARDWWKGEVYDFLDAYPFEGIWNDLNEPADDDLIPLNAAFWLDAKYSADPSDSRQWYQNLKNTYCIMECSLSHEALRAKHPDKRPFVLSRAGWPGIQRYALGWSGDNRAAFDHLRHNIPLGISVMISGQANFGHDVGGFIDTPSAELITRWHEWAVLTPYCRNHSKKTDIQREPWKFGSPYTELMRENIRFRYEIMPYLYTLAHESTVSGIPMNTPVVFSFVNDTETFGNNDYDFMVGESLLAAPVYREGVENRWVYLPEGSDWYFWHSDEKLVGGNWYNVDAPIGYLPLFARAGAIIPMGPWMRNVHEFTPGYVDFHVWPEGHSEFTLYEDDGESMGYLTGEYATTHLTSEREGNTWSFTIAAREGSYDPGERVHVIIAHAVNQALGVMWNGTLIPQYPALNTLHANPQGWYYDVENRQLHVKLPDTGEESVVNVTFGEGISLTWIGHSYSWPFTGEWDAGEDLWVNIESFPAGAAVSARVVYSTDDQNWLSTDMELGGLNGQNDWWHANLGSFDPGVTVRYAIEVVDGFGSSRWDNNGGSDFSISVNATDPADAPKWAGNMSWTEPAAHDQDFFVELQSWPVRPNQTARVLYAIGDASKSENWSYADMYWAGNRDSGLGSVNTAWQYNLGRLPAGSTVTWVCVVSGGGSEVWDNNWGGNYATTVE